MRKLTTEEIQHLYQFTQQHYVEYYDLQSELVDHLANGIEEQWGRNSNVTFEEALQIEFKKYGIFGFAELVEQRQKAMGKIYFKLVLKLMKEYITLPKVTLTVFMILLYYMVLKYMSYPVYVFAVTTFAIVCFVLFQAIKWRRKVASKKQAKEKIWMYEETIYSCGASLGVFQLLIQLPIHIMSSKRMEHFLSGNIVIVYISIFTIILGLIAYVLTIKIPKKAKEYIAKVHPEYQIV